MLVRGFWGAAIFGLCLTGMTVRASAQDIDICFLTAERVSAGETLGADEKAKAHEACLRALSATASVLQKYQLQEADFAIMGGPPKD